MIACGVYCSLDVCTNRGELAALVCESFRDP